jgi:anti-sigma factor RsiW
LLLPSPVHQFIMLEAAVAEAFFLRQQFPAVMAAAEAAHQIVMALMEQQTLAAVVAAQIL